MNKERNWTKVYSSTDLVQIEIIKGMLEEQDIPSIIINKQDSAYLFGEAELYVDAENAFEANQLIVKQSKS